MRKQQPRMVVTVLPKSPTAEGFPQNTQEQEGCQTSLNGE